MPAGSLALHNPQQKVFFNPCRCPQTGSKGARLDVVYMGKM